MKATKRILALVATGLAFGAVAAPSVEVVNIQQQYPWTNTVDITYTVQGIKDFPAKTATGEYASNETYFVTFEAKNGNNVLADVAGNTILTNALVEGNGTHITQWQPALGQQVANCTATPSVFRGEENAYLVINLETNAFGKFDYWYEPMSTQGSSNMRYTSKEYKTSKLVLRRIPAGVYTNGHANATLNHFGANSPHEVRVPQDYYVGIYPVTVAQYTRVMSNGGNADSAYPQTGVSWITLRNGAAENFVLEGDAENDQNFLVRLKGLDGGLRIDLPTEEMWEVAARAGSRTYFYWGDAMNTAYCWYQIGNTTREVGRKQPNAWGLFDTAGNVFESQLDRQDTAVNRANETRGIFEPRTTGNAPQSCNCRGGSTNFGAEQFSPSWCQQFTASVSGIHMGFRLALFPETDYSNGGQK